MLRRIWKSIDRLADIEEKRLTLETEQAYPTKPKPNRMTEIGHVDVEELNKNWRFNHPEV